MTCFRPDGHLTDAALTALVRGDCLEELDRLELAEHLAYCDQCLQRYTELLSEGPMLTPARSCRESLRRRIRQRAVQLGVSRYATAAAAVTLALTLLCMALDCVPPNLVGAFLLLMVLGEGLNKLGNTIPVVRTYLGGSVFCIFGGALLACSGWLPQSSAALMHSFVNDQGFLIFYISALICGSLFSIDRDLLLKGAVRLVPVGLLAIFSGVMVCGLMGAAGGTGFWDNILYIAVPMTSGGMTAGTVPLSHTFAEVLGVDAGDVLTRMAPATVLGNCLAIIFAGLLNDLGHRRPQLTGNGQLVNDGQPPRGADHGHPAESSSLPFCKQK